MASHSRGRITPRSHQSTKPVPPRNAHGQAPRADKWLPGDPDWEEIEARRGNFSHSAAVRLCAHLSNQYRKMWSKMANVLIDLDRILVALNEKKIPFVLTGAHGISSWTGRPRATHDVDILVKSGRNYARTVSVIRELYPQLEVRRFAGLTAFFPPGEKESIIEVIYPARPDNAETLRTAIWVEERNVRYRVPTLETALANKYGAMLTLGREVSKRVMDGVDFYNMVKHSEDEGRQPIDLARLESLGEMVWPGGGGKEILQFVEEVKAGKVPNPLG
jgi:hypothetical protein